MACNLVEGVTRACRDAVGGIQQLWITEFSNISSYTDTSGTITTMSQVASSKFWLFDLTKEDAVLDDTGNPSVENGTMFWTPTLAFSLKKLTVKNANIVEDLSGGLWAIIVKTNNGDYKALGFTRGMDLTEIKGMTGKAMGDFNGYQLTFTGKETHFTYDVNASVISSMTVGQ